MKTNEINTEVLNNLVENAYFAFDLIDEKNQSTCDNQFLAYSACSNMAMAILLDPNTVLFPAWNTLISLATSYAANLTFDRQLADFLQAEPVPEECDYDYLFNLMDQRVFLEAFIQCATNVCDSPEVRSSIRKARSHSFRFDHDLIENYPEIGIELASYAKDRYSWAVFPKHGFAWWLSPETFIDTTDISFENILTHEILKSEQKLPQTAALISESPGIPVFSPTPTYKASAKRAPIDAMNHTPARVSVAASTASSNHYSFSFKSQIYDSITLNIVINSDSSAALSVLDNSTGEYQLSKSLANCIVNVQLNNHIESGSFVIIESSAKFIIPKLVMPVKVVSIELHNPDGKLLESLTTSDY